MAELSSATPGASHTMEILVTVKQVPDPSIPAFLLELDNETKRIRPPAGLATVINGYDLNAVEAALALRDQIGAKVTVISVGDQSVLGALRRTLAMGADAAIHVDGPNSFEGDGACFAALLAEAIRTLPAPPDLILSGRQASDTDAGWTLFELATKLDLPVISPVSKLRRIEAGAIEVERIGENCTEILRAYLPVLLGVSNELNRPRYASMRGVMTSKKASIPTLSFDRVARATARLALNRLYLEEDKVAVELIAGSSPIEIGCNLADALHEAGIV
jgi:electron transfer flavoprotein beta subunit